MAYVGGFAMLYVLFSSFGNNSQSVPSISAMKVDVSGIQEGETLLLSWGGRPVIIYRRESADFSALRVSDERLLDESSKKSEQPDNAQNAYRSVKPEWFVAIALGTDQGCSITHVAKDSSSFQGQSWGGGFVDSCRKSRYDLAGRVYESQYADRNLVVPPYGVSADTVI